MRRQQTDEGPDIGIKFFILKPCGRPFATLAQTSIFANEMVQHIKIWKRIAMILCLVVFLGTAASAQCSICTKTAQQLGEKPGKSLNAAIIYLAATPLLIVGFIGYRWWKANGSSN